MFLLQAIERGRGRFLAGGLRAGTARSARRLHRHRHGPGPCTARPPAEGRGHRARHRAPHPGGGGGRRHRGPGGRARAAEPIRSVRIWPAADYTRLTIESRNPVRHSLLSVKNPERLVLDLEDVDLPSVQQQLASRPLQNDPYISALRAARNQPGARPDARRVALHHLPEDRLTHAGGVGARSRARRTTGGDIPGTTSGQGRRGDPRQGQGEAHPGQLMLPAEDPPRRAS